MDNQQQNPKNSFWKFLKTTFLIFITFGLILVFWLIKNRMDIRETQLQEREEKEKKSVFASRLRIAFGLMVIIGLMFAIAKMELGQYFMTSLLNAEQKLSIQHEAVIREGLPYEYGSTGPNSYDCSGFTGTVVKSALGIDLPRISRDQYTVGREIEFNNLGVGDLVFFDTSGGGNISHVGIVTEVQGDKKFMTHANSYYGKVMKEELKGYWLETYYGARELTNVTATMVASSDPDTSYTPPVIENDQYDGEFPPSEPPADEVTGDNTSSTNNNDTNASTSNTDTNTTSATTDNSDSTDSTSSDSATDAQVFPDVPSTHQNYKAITYLKKNGIIGGYADGTFKPGNTITRAETLKIALNGAGINTSAYASTASMFSDVDDNNTLKQYINYAKYSGIVNGYPDGTYKPNNTITRGEASKVLINIQGISPVAPTVDPYADVSKTLDLAKYINYVKEKKLMDISSAYFGINTNMTRGDVAEMMYRLIALDKTGASAYTPLLSI